jgi:hypothetical protein
MARLAVTRVFILYTGITDFKAPFCYVYVLIPLLYCRSLIVFQ